MHYLLLHMTLTLIFITSQSITHTLSRASKYERNRKIFMPANFDITTFISHIQYQEQTKIDRWVSSDSLSKVFTTSNDIPLKKKTETKNILCKE